MGKTQKSKLEVGNTVFHFEEKTLGTLVIFQLDKEGRYIPTKIKKVDESRDTVFFDNGINIKFYHDVDCCEYNYVDWKSLTDCLIPNMSHDTIRIQKLSTGFKFLNYITVNCYTEQSGYYSDTVEFDVNYNSVFVRSGKVQCDDAI